MTGSAMAAIRSTSATRGLDVRTAWVTQPPRLGVPNHTGGTVAGDTMKHARTRVLSLQAMGRRRCGARLLDDDRSGVDRGAVRGPAGCLGAAARNGRGVRRPAHLRVPQFNHVLAEVLLLLRTPEAETPRVMRLPGPDRARAGGDAGHAVVEVEGRSHHSRHTPRPGRGA